MLRSAPNQSCSPNEYRLVVVDVVAAEERVRGEVGVERRLELIGEVAVGDPAKDLAIGIGDPRVPGAPRKASFLEDLFTDGHPPTLPQARLKRDPRSLLRRSLRNRPLDGQTIALTVQPGGQPLPHGPRRAWRRPTSRSTNTTT